MSVFPATPCTEARRSWVEPAIPHNAHSPASFPFSLSYPSTRAMSLKVAGSITNSFVVAPRSNPEGTWPFRYLVHAVSIGRSIPYRHMHRIANPGQRKGPAGWKGGDKAPAGRRYTANSSSSGDSRLDGKEYTAVARRGKHKT